MRGRTHRFGLGVALALSALAGCQSTENNAPVASAAAPAPSEGSISMALTLGGGFTFSSVSYDLSGNGFHKAGTIDVSGSTVLSTVIGGIPYGTGYVLNLTAHDAGNKLTPCTGTASFDITSSSTVAVPVHLVCRQVAQTNPSVPIPPWARYALAALLLGLGARRVRRRVA